MMMLILTFLQIRSDRELRSQLISVVAVELKRGGADFNIQVDDGFQFSRLYDSVQLCTNSTSDPGFGSEFGIGLVLG